MHTTHVIAGRVQGGGNQEGAVVLRPGAHVVARVASIERDGQGTLALAGALVRARLPKGVKRGQKLALQVVGRSGSDVVLRAQLEEAGQRPPSTPTHLSELPAPLRRFLEEPGDDEGADGERATGEAAFQLRTTAGGPIEVRLRLLPGGVRAAVLVDAGAPAAEAAAASAELQDGLAATTGRPASVLVAARPFVAHG